LKDHDSKDVIELVVAYAKQETIEPLRDAGRWIMWGLASMTFVSGGVILIILGILRLVQSALGEGFEGTWSWVAYGISMCGCLAVVGFALQKMRKAEL